MQNHQVFLTITQYTKCMVRAKNKTVVCAYLAMNMIQQFCTGTLKLGSLEIIDKHTEDNT